MPTQSSNRPVVTLPRGASQDGGRDVREVAEFIALLAFILFVWVLQVIATE
jgi:hypothetical protein